ncbi:MAG TPA: substrate-binding domain-containing protein [Herbaspirillum sp.]|jgi:molybdate transport system substrate-binding protein
MDLKVLSAGAAKGLVTDLQQKFSTETGVDIRGSFGAVGAIHEQILAGEPCDVIVLSAVLLDDLIRSGHVLAGSSVPLGYVKTGIAARTGQPAPAIEDRSSLTTSLRAAKGIYVSDIQRSTAGAHFAKVLRQLGIYDEVEPRIRAFPNGAIAMAALAKTDEQPAIGCTQSTEIIHTEGVTLIGQLPKEFELATLYSVAISSKAAQPEQARRLIELLTETHSETLRTAGGFEL